MKRLIVTSLCLLIAACSSSEEAKDPPAVGQDAAADSPPGDALSGDENPGDGAVSDGGSGDGAADGGSLEDVALGDGATPDGSAAEGGSFETCEDACAQTKLTITLGGKTGTIDRAQFGFNAPEQGKQTLHIEAHFGGEPACPSETSPTPDLTVIFGSVPVPVDSTPIENTPVTLLDFTGELSPNPLDKALTATLTPVAIKTTPENAAFIAFDVNVTFANGTMTGHVYAAHCDSLDE